MNFFKIISLLILAIVSFQTLAQTEMQNVELKTQIAPNNKNIRYNGTLYSVVNKNQAELQRYSEDYFKNGMDGTINEQKARTQPGVSISFKTSSPLIKLNFAELENSDIRKRRFSIFRNGKLAYDYISDLQFIIANPSKEEAEWEVYLPCFSGVKFRGMELPEEYALTDLPAENKPLYMAIGNSITHGVGQSGTLDTYAYQVADALGFRHINLATGGSRISTETIRNFTGVSPRLITILWGYNDVNQEKPLSEVIPEYASLVEKLCAKFTEADIYCILQTFTTTVVGRRNENNRIDSLRSWTQSAVQHLQKKYDNLYIIDGAKYVTSEADLKDAVHLNVRGANKLAEGIVLEYNKNKYQGNKGFEKLFNGKNWDGWHLKLRNGDDDLAKKVFAIEDGMVHVFNDQFPDKYNLNTGENATHGLFFTNKSYSKYILRFEYKWGTKIANNFDKWQYDAGCYYHVYDDKVWPKGLEYQIRYNHITKRNHTGDFWAAGTHLDWTSTADTTSFLLPKNGGINAGQKKNELYACTNAKYNALNNKWNKCEIIVMGDAYTIHKLNGEIVNMGTNLSHSEGMIGFQSETAEIFYRNIEIKEFDKIIPIEEFIK